MDKAQKVRYCGTRQIGFELTVDGETKHVVITEEAVKYLHADLTTDAELLNAVAESPYIAKEVANRVRRGGDRSDEGDADLPLFLRSTDFP